MELNELKRINNLADTIRMAIVTRPVIPINKYVNRVVDNQKLGVYYEVDKSIENTIFPIPTKEADLELLTNQGVIDIKTEDEMINTYGVSPIQLIEQFNVYTKLLNDEYKLQKDNERLNNKLGPMSKMLKTKGAKNKIEEQISNNNKKLEKIDDAIRESGKIFDVYSTIRSYVMTDTGKYISMNRSMQSYVDINSSLGLNNVQIPYNELNTFLTKTIAGNEINLPDNMISDMTNPTSLEPKKVKETYSFNPTFKKSPVENFSMYAF